MTDEEYSKDTFDMLGTILLLEFRIKCLEEGKSCTGDDFDKYLESRNPSRELLDRGFIKAFFGGGPKGINSRVRKALVQLMLKAEKEYPSIKGENWEARLKEYMSAEYK